MVQSILRAMFNKPSGRVISHLFQIWYGCLVIEQWVTHKYWLLNINTVIYLKISILFIWSFSCESYNNDQFCRFQIYFQRYKIWKLDFKRSYLLSILSTRLFLEFCNLPKNFDFCGPIQNEIFISCTGYFYGKFKQLTQTITWYYVN